MHVHELMTHAPGVCTTTDHLTRAAQIMWERDCGAVPVIDGEGRLTGIVTDRDVCMAAYTQGRALHEIPVGEVMSKVLYTVGPDATLEDALEALQRHEVRRLPVTDSRGQLLGILSLADFARAARGWRKAAAQAELISALAAVSRARDLAAPVETPASKQVATKVIVPAAAPKKPASRKSPAPKASSRRR